MTSGSNPDHCIDKAWCDLQGAYLEGWVHAGAAPFHTIHLVCGVHRVPVVPTLRPDVLAAYPFLPPGQPTGFAAYIACPPFQPLALELQGPHGTTTLPVRIADPIALGPPEIPGTGGEAPLPAFAAAMKARRGTVIEIGARVVGQHSGLNAPLFRPDCRFIGVDIHPAPGVDLVADVHYLADFVAPASIDGVFSLAVFEHLAAPWLAAAAINRVLRPGGETLHLVPHAWPVHERPNDFWRFSEAALAQLFGPATGFEVLEARLGVRMQLTPEPAFRHGAYLQLPLHFAFGAAWVHARKVAEVPEGAVRWPLPRAASAARSRAYPVTE